jgi:hypothetical protein
MLLIANANPPIDYTGMKYSQTIVTPLNYHGDIHSS